MDPQDVSQNKERYLQQLNTNVSALTAAIRNQTQITKSLGESIGTLTGQQIDPMSGRLIDRPAKIKGKTVKPLSQTMQALDARVGELGDSKKSVDSSAKDLKSSVDKMGEEIGEFRSEIKDQRSFLKKMGGAAKTTGKAALGGTLGLAEIVASNMEMQTVHNPRADLKQLKDSIIKSMSLTMGGPVGSYLMSMVGGVLKDSVLGTKGFLEKQGLLGDQGNELPQFARGGTIPGKPGKPRMVIAHGGETVIPTKNKQESKQFLGSAGIQNSSKQQHSGVLDRLDTLILLQQQTALGINKTVSSELMQIADILNFGNSVTRMFSGPILEGIQDMKEGMATLEFSLKGFFVRLPMFLVKDVFLKVLGKDMLWDMVMKNIIGKLLVRGALIDTMILPTIQAFMGKNFGAGQIGAMGAGGGAAAMMGAGGPMMAAGAFGGKVAYDYWQTKRDIPFQQLMELRMIKENTATLVDLGGGKGKRDMGFLEKFKQFGEDQYAYLFDIPGVKRLGGLAERGARAVGGAAKQGIGDWWSQNYGKSAGGKALTTLNQMRQGTYETGSQMKKRWAEEDEETQNLASYLFAPVPGLGKIKKLDMLTSSKLQFYLMKMQTNYALESMKQLQSINRNTVIFSTIEQKKGKSPFETETDKKMLKLTEIDLELKDKEREDNKKLQREKEAKRLMSMIPGFGWMSGSEGGGGGGILDKAMSGIGGTLKTALGLGGAAAIPLLGAKLLGFGGADAAGAGAGASKIKGLLGMGGKGVGAKGLSKLLPGVGQALMAWEAYKLVKNNEGDISPWQLLNPFGGGGRDDAVMSKVREEVEKRGGLNNESENKSSIWESIGKFFGGGMDKAATGMGAAGSILHDKINASKSKLPLTAYRQPTFDSLGPIEGEATKFTRKQWDERRRAKSKMFSYSQTVNGKTQEFKQVVPPTKFLLGEIKETLNESESSMKKVLNLKLRGTSKENILEEWRSWYQWQDIRRDEIRNYLEFLPADMYEQEFQKTQSTLMNHELQVSRKFENIKLTPSQQKEYDKQHPVRTSSQFDNEWGNETDGGKSKTTSGMNTSGSLINKSKETVKNQTFYRMNLNGERYEGTSPPTEMARKAITSHLHMSSLLAPRHANNLIKDSSPQLRYKYKKGWERKHAHIKNEVLGLIKFLPKDEQESMKMQSIYALTQDNLLVENAYKEVKSNLSEKLNTNGVKALQNQTEKESRLDAEGGMIDSIMDMGESTGSAISKFAGSVYDTARNIWAPAATTIINSSSSTVSAGGGGSQPAPSTSTMEEVIDLKKVGTGEAQGNY